MPNFEVIITWIPALEIALRRIRAWHVPPNWSVRDWLAEVRAVATLAAWEATRQYEPSRDVPLPGFLYQRVLARALTRYRQEWTYASRFVPEAKQNGTGETRTSEPAIEPSSNGEEIRDALAGLPAPDQWLIEQIFWKDRTEADVARELGICQSAVSKRKSAILRGLRGCSNGRNKKSSHGHKSTLQTQSIH